MSHGTCTCPSGNMSIQYWIPLIFIFLLSNSTIKLNFIVELDNKIPEDDVDHHDHNDDNEKENGKININKDYIDNLNHKDKVNNENNNKNQNEYINNSENQTITTNESISR